MRHLLMLGVVCCVLLLVYVLAAAVMILRSFPTAWEPFALLVAVLLMGVSAILSLRFIRGGGAPVAGVSVLHLVIAVLPALLFWGVALWFLAETLSIAERGDPYYKLTLYLGVVMGAAPALLSTLIFASVLALAWSRMRGVAG